MRTFHATRITALMLAAGALWAPFAAPAQQRTSLAERIAVLEQRSANNQANVDLLRQVNLLKEEVQALRAQIEELTNQHDLLKQTARAQYLDLDGRLDRMDGSGPGTPVEADAPDADAPASAPPSPARAAPEASRPTARVPSARVAADMPAVDGIDATPGIYGDAGTLAQGVGERETYDAAFGALKAGEYAQSARRFQEFLDRYPDGAYAPNALYWLGESYYVTQNYPLAQTQFQALFDRYPTHDKAPGAMLKVGLSQLGREQLDAAERTLADVITRYPGTDAARVADDRLGALRLGRLR